MKETNKSLRLKVAVFLCLSIGGITLAQKDGEIESRNYMRDIGAVAKSLSRFEPRPVWETMVKADQADIIELVGENYLLIGTIQLSVNIGRPDYSDIYLFDRHSGKEIWRSKREPLRNGSYAVIADNPLIILQGNGIETSYYTAYDPTNGKIVWEYKIDGRYNVQISPIDFALLIWAKKSSEVVIRKLNLADGRILWESTYPTSLGHGLSSQSLHIDDRHAYIAHDKITKLDLKSGSLIWSSPKLASDKSHSFVKAQNGILTWNDTAIHLLKETNGSLVWGPVKSKHFVVTMDVPENSQNIAFATCRKITGEYRGDFLFKKIILGIDLDTGNISWEHEAEDRIQSALLYHINNLYYTTSNTLFSVDIRSGISNFKKELPIKAESKLPDILIPAQELILIVKEQTGVAAFSTSNKHFKWYQKYYENIYHSWFWYATRSGLLKKYEVGFKSSEEARDNEIAWWRGWNKTVNIQWSVDGDLSGMGSLDRFGRHMSLFQTSLAFSSILQAGIIKDVIEGIVSRLRLCVANSSRLHFNSIQGNYYVRPYFKQGEGVLIVDLNNGKRCDLEYSAPNKGMKLFTMRLPEFTIDPKTNTLYTFGISFDKNKYQKYVKIKVGMPYPSLQAFDLSTLKYEKIITNDMMITVAAKKGDNDKILQYINEGISINSRTGEGKTALYMAVLKGHLHTVQFLVEQGADLEAEDINGKTALWIACEKGHSDMVRVLIEAGANVNTKDKYDKTVLSKLKGGNKEDIIKMLQTAGAK